LLGELFRKERDEEEFSRANLVVCLEISLAIFWSLHQGE